MLCLKIMILFRNLELIQIYCLNKLQILKFEFGSDFTIVFKVIKIENLRMTIQTLSFSNSLFMIS